MIDTKTVLHSSERGIVSLEEMVDWSYEASHPATVDSTTIARVLQGVRVGATEGPAAYAAQDVEFLSPLLSEALARAKAEHVVTFQLSSESARESGVTGGTVYLKGPSLYLTPIRTQWSRSSSSSSGSLKTSMPGTGASEVLSFEPPSVMRSQKASSDVASGRSNLTSFVIDHHALAKLPVTMPVQKIVQTPAVKAEALIPLAPAPVARPATIQTPPAPPPTKPSLIASPKTTGSKSSKPTPVKKTRPQAKPATEVVKPKPAASPEHQAILDVLKNTPSSGVDSSSAVK